MRSKWMEARRAAAAAGACLALALLAAGCGGGEQVTDFEASRVVAFGDETSLIVDAQGSGNGLKYSVNGLASDTDPTIDCRSLQIWVQAVAAEYGLVFPQCNFGSNAVTGPSSRIRATLGARVADLPAQIAAQAAESPLHDGDLVTLLVGANDVFDAYAQYPTLSEAQLTAIVEAAGAEVGRQANLLSETGAKVLISTIIDVGRTPFALAEKAANTDTDRAALLTRLSNSFNAQIRATIVNDGRRIGLVLLDELIGIITRFPGSNGISNTTVPVCDLTKSAQTPPSILDCTALTVVTGATASVYLWADDRHLSGAAQNVFGDAAVSRAHNNPF